MARFKRLTRDDLNTLTRDQLLPRLEAEQQYWMRKERSAMSPADQEARKEFSDILSAVVNPKKLSTVLQETSAWLKGERATGTDFWDTAPGTNRS